MKMKVNNIPPGGEDCTEVYEPEKLDLATPEIKVNKPIRVDYNIMRDRSELFVKAKVDAFLETNCVRCLEQIDYPIKKEYSFSYDVKDMDVIDTTDDLRQEIILDYPMKLLCRENCLGLCPRCGESLNKGKCRCNR